MQENCKAWHILTRLHRRAYRAGSHFYGTPRDLTAGAMLDAAIDFFIIN